MSNSIPEVAPKEKIMIALEYLGYHVVRQGTHIAMSYFSNSGVQFPLTIPDQVSYKASTIRAIISKAGISKQDFIQAYNKA